MKSRVNIVISLLLISTASILGQTSIYTNDMDYVLGDVKQAFIQDQISTSDQIENILIGFKTMKVNGIRVPICPEGETPNEPALSHFIMRAVEEGFKIFANPAQSSGGMHVANQGYGGTHNVTEEKIQILINRVLDFDETYDCTWINPFNEDGKTNNPWTVDEMNTVYKGVYDGLKNAELIGSCAWGIPASIDVFKKTNIKDYITVSTTHNLGFNHSSWTEFINLSHAAGLPVWDSEVNNDDKNKDGYTRIVAAIEYKVDGLVLYNSRNFISLTTGEVNATGEKFMAMYLKSTSLDENYNGDLFANIYNENQGFRIEFLNNERHDVSIVDISGKQVRSYNNSESEIQVSDLDKGMYVVVMSTNNNRQVEKVMVH